MMLAPVQMAYHVPDPAAAALHAAAAFGWGPFYLMEHIALARASYRGTETVFDHSSAYGQAGELMVEFITQHNDAPSALRDLYEPQESGLHHVAVFVPNFAAALDQHRSLGRVIALEACTSTGVEFAMVDTVKELGHMLEVYEARDDLAKFYALVRRKATGWDGSNPLRYLG